MDANSVEGGTDVHCQEAALVYVDTGQPLFTVSYVRNFAANVLNKSSYQHDESQTSLVIATLC